MNFFDNYYKVGETIKSKAARQEYFAAVIEYYYTGVEPIFKSEAAEVGFAGVRYSLDKSRRQSSNRRSKKAEPNANQTRTKPKRNANQNATTDEVISIRSREEEEEEEVITSNEVISSRSVFDEADEAPTTYALQCLAAFNEIMGTTYGSMPVRCNHTLERFGDKYPLDEVRRMIEYKREEWQGTQLSRALTPNTLFSPDHFEQYMNQSRSSAAEKSKYEQYD